MCCLLLVYFPVWIGTRVCVCVCVTQMQLFRGLSDFLFSCADTDTWCGFKLAPTLYPHTHKNVQCSTRVHTNARILVAERRLRHSSRGVAHILSQTTHKWKVSEFHPLYLTNKLWVKVFFFYFYYTHTHTHTHTLAQPRICFLLSVFTKASLSSLLRCYKATFTLN